MRTPRLLVLVVLAACVPEASPAEKPAGAETGGPDTGPRGTDSAADTGSETGHTGTSPDTGAGCPDPPADLVEFGLPDGYGHPTAVMMASGQVGSFPLPLLASGYASQQLTWGESAGGAYTPNPMTVEISISACKGMIDPDTTDFCNLYSLNGSYNAITWFGQGVSGLDSYEAVNARGYCWAPEVEGPHWVNMRWTYDACAFGASVCGLMVQLNAGSW